MAPTDTPALLADALRAVLESADQARRALAIYDAEQARLTTYRQIADTARDDATPR